MADDIHHYESIEQAIGGLHEQTAKLTGQTMALESAISFVIDALRLHAEPELKLVTQGFLELADYMRTKYPQGYNGSAAAHAAAETYERLAALAAAPPPIPALKLIAGGKQSEPAAGD